MVAAFRARCRARAYLYDIGDIDLQEAVDVLQETAGALPDLIGQDAVQAIIAEAFRSVIGRELFLYPPRRRAVPAVILAEAERLRLLGDEVALRRLLREHREFVPAIIEFWEGLLDERN